MKRLQFLAIALFAFASFVVAQDKLLTIDDIFSPDPAKRVRFGGTPVAVQWAADGKSFKQVVNGRLMRVDAVSGQAVPYFDSAQLAAALQRNGVKAEDAAAMANSPQLHFNANETGIVLNHASDIWYYDIGTRNLKKLTSNYDAELEADF